ncbi:unnamed protein product [Urochloa humidicola]
MERRGNVPLLQLDTDSYARSKKTCRKLGTDACKELKDGTTILPLPKRCLTKCSAPNSSGCCSLMRN